eukprot:6263895-Pyramimonas_sp.AAC.3
MAASPFRLRSSVNSLPPRRGRQQVTPDDPADPAADPATDLAADLVADPAADLATDPGGSRLPTQPYSHAF